MGTVSNDHRVAATLSSVEGELNYLKAGQGRPVSYTFESPAGVPWVTGELEPRRVAIHDGRPLVALRELSLDRSGFTQISHRSVVADFSHDATIRDIYYREAETLLRDITGAEKIVVFDHTLRDSAQGSRRTAELREPVRRVHNDQTFVSAPRRVRDHLPPEEAEERLKHRFAIINLAAAGHGGAPAACAVRCALHRVRGHGAERPGLSRQGGRDLFLHLEPEAPVVLVPEAAARRGPAAEDLRLARGRHRALHGTHCFRRPDRCTRYADIKGRMRKLGRDPDHLKILPAAFVVVGDTVEEARAIRAKLDSLVHYDSAIASLSIQLGHDASKFDPDAPLPDVPETNASQSSHARVIELARSENLTVRQLAQRLGGYGGLAFVGTPQTIADEMQEWLEAEGSDGFNGCFRGSPAGSMPSSTRWCPSCSAAASSGVNTKVVPCARTSVCRARPTDSLPRISNDRG